VPARQGRAKVRRRATSHKPTPTPPFHFHHITSASPCITTRCETNVQEWWLTKATKMNFASEEAFDHHHVFDTDIANFWWLFLVVGTSPNRMAFHYHQSMQHTSHDLWMTMSSLLNTRRRAECFIDNHSPPCIDNSIHTALNQFRSFIFIDMMKCGRCEFVWLWNWGCESSHDESLNRHLHAIIEWNEDGVWRCRLIQHWPS